MKLYRQQFLAMGCPCEIGVFSHDVEAARFAISGAENEIHRLDQKYSHFQQDSHITQLQISAQKPGGVKVDPETSALLDYAATQFKLSHGLFDITAGRLSHLWHKRDRLPSSAERCEALEFVGWLKLRWRAPQLVMPVGMQLELGGLVKEYAADRAALFLKRKKMNSAFVELGGDIHVTGPRPDGQPWSMGIRNPGYRLQKNSKSMASIAMSIGGRKPSRPASTSFTLM